MLYPAPAPHECDDGFQQAVLLHLVLSYPAWHTVDELERAFWPHGRSAADRDELDRALRDLAADGLVHRRDTWSVASRSAVRCVALLG